MVSVTDEVVKVAAYTDEFDNIVVLGFPTKAIDLVAPGKRRPGVGTPLIVVSQFTPRSPNLVGVQGDITMGPRTFSECTRWPFISLPLSFSLLLSFFNITLFISFYLFFLFPLYLLILYLFSFLFI